MAILKLKNGVANGTVFALKLGVTRIGRGEGNDYRVPDQSVSHAHCEFHLDRDGCLFVKDLGSSNGTYINGERVDEARLLPGQILSLGGLDLAFDNRWWTTSSASNAEIPSPVTGRNSDGSTAFFSRKATQRVENPSHAGQFS